MTITDELKGKFSKLTGEEKIPFMKLVMSHSHYSNWTWRHSQNEKYINGGLNMRTFNLVAALIVISLVLVGCAGHGTSAKGKEIPIEAAAIKLIQDVNEGGYKIIGTTALKKKLDEDKNMTVISTLPVAEDKEYGTLPRAINAGLPKTEKELTQADKDNLLKAAGPDKEKEILLYCGYVSCRRSSIGAKILVEEGYKNVYKYPGGITAWDEAGYPISK